MTLTTLVPTKSDWLEMTPFQQGAASYWYGAREDSEVPDANPYAEGSDEHREFRAGQDHACIITQDMP